MIPTNSADLDGVPIHFAEVATAGPALLILHGATGSHTSFLPLLPLLARRAHVYALDLRGHNLSGHTPGAYQLPDYGRDVLTFQQTLIGRPVVVAGHSLGGLIAVWLAAHAPDRVLGIFLEDPPLYIAQQPRFQTTGFHAYFVALRDHLTGHHARGGTVEEMAAHVGRAPFDDRRTTLEAIGAEAVRARAIELHRLDPTMLAPLIAGTVYGPDEPDDLLAQVRCPAHLLAGQLAYGGALDGAEVDRAVGRLGHATHTVLEATGHLIHEERPVEYVEILMQFMAAFD